MLFYLLSHLPAAYVGYRIAIDRNADKTVGAAVGLFTGAWGLAIYVYFVMKPKPASTPGA